MSLRRLLIAALLGPELARWKASGHTPVFWWRDDDARGPTPALERLLALSVRFEAPITLAAVPDGDIATLARGCRAIPGVELAVHGFQHENRAPPGQPSGEVNDLDRLADVMSDLGTAIDVFRRAGVAPKLFVPPWNNAHPTLKRALNLQSLALSCYGEMREAGSPGRPSGRHALETHAALSGCGAVSAADAPLAGRAAREGGLGRAVGSADPPSRPRRGRLAVPGDVPSRRQTCRPYGHRRAGGQGQGCSQGGLVSGARPPVSDRT
jgi:hypothetical protein